MLHAHAAGQGRIGLNGNVVLGAGLSDASLRVEGVDFDLVDDGCDARLRCHQLFNL